MTQRQCPECGSELMLARCPDQPSKAANRRYRAYLLALKHFCGGAFTAEQLREWKRAKQLDNARA